MATNLSPYSFNKTLIASVGLHGVAFALAMFFSIRQMSPLPVGVELAYDAAPQIQTPAPTAVAVKAVPVQQVAPAAADEVSDGKLAPVIETQNPSASANTSAVPIAGATSGREGVANGSEVSTEQRYLFEITKLLERKKTYPSMAKRMGHSGTVTLRFTLKADGSISESEVIEKSPYETLNQAAMTLVQSIDGLKPFPADIQKGSLSITVPIQYSLN